VQPISVITGGTDGIGRLVASHLAGAGHRLVLLARNAEKAERVVAELEQETGRRDVAWVRCDLSSFASVRAASERLSAELPRIDVLVNDAGVYGAEREETVDGHEAHLQVNYLAPYLLTRLLLPALRRAGAPRIVNVTGETARIARIRLRDLERTRRYTALGAYAQSKLAQIVATRTLASELAGTSMLVVAVHPGPAATGHLVRAPRWLRWMWGLLPGPAQAARNVARLALASDLRLRSGDYVLARWRAPAPCAAYDLSLARALEARTRSIVGLPP
jgi:NAD(P)-dependent dehydrogenase (short-subunit alcohol dehydrogenase family)